MLSSFKDLRKTDPILALIFAFLIFSMSGIPPLGGFFVKLDVLSAFLETSHFASNILLFLFTVASFFYYLRVNKILFFDKIKSLNFKKRNAKSYFFCLKKVPTNNHSIQSCQFPPTMLVLSIFKLSYFSNKILKLDSATSIPLPPEESLELKIGKRQYIIAISILIFLLVNFYIS